MLPVDGDALLVGRGGEGECKGVDGPLAVDGGVGEGVGLALAEES